MPWPKGNLKMDKDIKFEEDVNKAYNILWKLFKGENNQGCDYDTEKEQDLLDILNLIDTKLGR